MKNSIGIMGAIIATLVLSAHGSAQIAVLSESVVEHVAGPGGVHEGRIVLVNTSRAPQEAKVYQTDYRFFADGRNMFADPATTTRSNAKWITFTPAQVVLAPGAKATVAFRVVVPAGVRLSGSYWSMLMVETISAGSPESSGGARRVHVGLETRVRYGTQIATHIASTGTASIGFDSVKATIERGGQKRVSFDFLNTGERAHRLAISLQLYSESGSLVKTLDQKRGLLYPGTSGRQLFDLGMLPAGTYRALIVADAGGNEVFGAQYTLKF